MKKTFRTVLLAAAVLTGFAASSHATMITAPAQLPAGCTRG